MAEINKEQITIILSGRIDSSNAAETEADILSKLAGKGDVSITLDASKLEYISSAGLRVILRIKKNYSDLKITGVNPEV